jgi:hypothetical protein
MADLTDPAAGANGAGPRPEPPSDAHVAITIIAGIVVMFLVGFLMLVVSMVRDWQ